MSNTRKILTTRLKELRHKMKAAETAKEKAIYTEAINHCILDIRRSHAKIRRNIIRNTIAGVVVIALIVTVLYLVSMLSGEPTESPTIGHAVTENAN